MATTADRHDVTVPDARLNAGPVRRVALVSAGLGGLGFIALAAVASFVAPDTWLKDVFTAYLVGFIFWAGVPLGALALMNIAYLTTASWGVLLRRTFRASTRTLSVVGLLLCPVGVSLYVGHGAYSPYWWADESWEHVTDGQKEAAKAEIDKLKAAGAAEEVAAVAAVRGIRPEAVVENQHKIHDFLMPWFFLLRAALYLTAMGLIARYVDKWGRQYEENDDPAAWDKLQTLGGPAVILYALGGAVIATDWAMSVEPTWASSMFPVVWGMNQFVCAMALGAFVLYTLTDGRGEARLDISDKFRIDLGSLLFGFTMVWAYGTFSQYMLIWAGNLPEEIVYYRKRGDHGWEYLAYFLMLFHWLVPFVVFVFRGNKTNPQTMRALCLMLLVVSAADVIWWVVPAYPHEAGWTHVPLAVAALAMVGGLWGLAFAKELDRQTVLPANTEGKFLAGWGHHH